VLAALQGNDLILCQITSQAREDRYSVRLDNADFVSGGLSQSGRIRPSRLFTADSSIVVYRAGQVSTAKLKEVHETLIRILGE
jgi:mRNA interferase MazF